MCNHPVGRFSGVHVGGDGSFAVDSVIGCGRWDCPDCGIKKLKQLLKRIFEGDISKLDVPNGFRSKYFCKFLTLTLPGREFRESHTADESFLIIARAWAKLSASLRKTYGKDFLYFRVVERQEDGFPHYHVLLVGRAIAPKGVLDYIKHLWSETYGMGFVKLNVVTSLERSIRYLCKYLTKHFIGNKGFLPPRGIRLFSSSRGALLRLKKTHWDWKNVYVGATSSFLSRSVSFDFGVSDSESFRRMLFVLKDWVFTGGKNSNMEMGNEDRDFRHVFGRTCET
jgi:hypothetical protein